VLTNYLKILPSLSHIASEVLDEIAMHMRGEEFPTGKTLVKEGDQLQAFLVILEGSMEQSNLKGDASLLESGSVVGSEALHLDLQLKSPYSLTCKTPMKVIHISVFELSGILQKAKKEELHSAVVLLKQHK